MKCPSCGYNTFDTYERCKRCGALFAGGRWKDRLRDVEPTKLFEDQPDQIDINNDPVVIEKGIDNEVRNNPEMASKPTVEDNDKDLVNKRVMEEDFLTLASFTRRLFAFLIDLCIVVLTSFITLIFGLFAAGYDPMKGILNLSYIIIPVYIILTLLASSYLMFLHAYSGKTVGKLIFGIRVVKEDGSGISLTDSFVRWIGYYISTLPLFYGYFSALFDLHYQTWHDKLSKSFVINDR